MHLNNEIGGIDERGPGVVIQSVVRTAGGPSQWNSSYSSSSVDKNLRNWQTEGKSGGREDNLGGVRGP